MHITESRWRHFRHGAQKLVLPTWETLDPETKHICQQFLTYHMDKAMHDLVRDRRYHSLTQIHLSNVSLHAEYYIGSRWRLKWYQSVIVGTELVDWLILVGLAHDRSQGVRYGRHLLAGRIIRHISNDHHFHDQPYFYTFLPADR